MQVKKPLLAATIDQPSDLNLIQFPAYVSPKIDGVRGMTDDKGHPWTRKGEPFANKAFNAAMDKLKLANLDFEIGIGKPNGNTTFFTLTSGWLRREDGIFVEPVTLYVFDRTTSGSFDERWWKNKTPEIKTGNIRLVWVPQHLVHSAEEVLELEEMYNTAGWEGIMIRGALLTAQYKHGRASMRSQELMKFKRFADDEGVIIGFEEQETNTNEKTADAFGHSKRSSAKAGKVPNGRAGKIIVSCPKFTEPVTIGTGLGLTHELRKHMWENQEQYLGRTVTFWHQPGSDYVKARFPSFKGFRDDGL